MKTLLLAITAIAISTAMIGCVRATVPPPPNAPQPPSALVVSLDAIEIAAATAAPWFPGESGAWMLQVAPTVQEIATDLQQPNPFAQAQAIDHTLRSVLASEPAMATMDSTQQKMAASVVGAIDAFLALYEQQAGIPGATGAFAAHRVPAGLPLNDADISILKSLQNGK